ncbi:MAG TPA: MFS transporter [Acidimicrobiales bacterium]|nr:MFS transporter [Acidimicrobiales bacterium]
MSSTRTSLAWISSALSALVVSINLTVMSVAFDSMRRDFPGTELRVMGWVLSVYTIVFGALLVPAGRLADHLGRRRIFLWGLGIMSVSSTLAGLAPSVWVIIVGRVGQGAAAACLVPSTLGLLLEAVPVEQRVTVTAFYSVLASVGGIAGPTVGALLIQESSWRAAFFIAPVLAVLSWITGIRSLPETRRVKSGPLPDLLGSLLVVVSLSAFSLGVLQSRDWGWADARTIGALAFAVAAAVWFWRRSSVHPVPVLPMKLTRNRSFALANIASVLYGGATGALLFGTVLFLREVWDYDIVDAGLGLLPLAVASMVTSWFGGRLGNRYGERAVAVPGALVVASGLAWFAWRVGAQPEFVREWLPGGTLIGFGMGLTYPMIGSACVRGVEGADLSVASAANRMTLQIGNAVGIALVIAILGDASGHAMLDQMRIGWAVTAAMVVAVAATMALLDRPAHVMGVSASRAHVAASP